MILGVLSLTACQSPGTTSKSGSTQVATTASNLTNVTVPAVATADVSDTFSVTYYKLSATVAPLGSYPTQTYTGTGYCVVYKSSTYCWDDGVKTLQFTVSGTVHGPYTYTYWSLGPTSIGNGWGQCSGGCTGDIMTSPLYMSTDVNNNLPSSVSATKVLTTGTAVVNTCTEDNQVLNCSDFTVDLNQATL